jgi:hypothetical protein
VSLAGLTGLGFAGSWDFWAWSEAQPQKPIKAAEASRLITDDFFMVLCRILYVVPDDMQPSA